MINKISCVLVLAILCGVSTVFAQSESVIEALPVALQEEMVHNEVDPAVVANFAARCGESKPLESDEGWFCEVPLVVERDVTICTHQLSLKGGLKSKCTPPPFADRQCSPGSFDGHCLQQSADLRL